eukprot:g50245.t1
MVERNNVDGNVIVRTTFDKASEEIVPEADLKLVHPSFKVGDKVTTSPFMGTSYCVKRLMKLVKPPTQEGFSQTCSIEFELLEEKLKDTGLAPKLVNLPAWLLLPSDTQSEESQSATEDSKDNRKKRSRDEGRHVRMMHLFPSLRAKVDTKWGVQEVGFGCRIFDKNRREFHVLGPCFLYRKGWFWLVRPHDKEVPGLLWHEDVDWGETLDKVDQSQSTKLMKLLEHIIRKGRTADEKGKPPQNVDIKVIDVSSKKEKKKTTRRSKEAELSGDETGEQETKKPKQKKSRTKEAEPSEDETSKQVTKKAKTKSRKAASAEEDSETEVEDNKVLPFTISGMSRQDTESLATTMGMWVKHAQVHPGKMWFTTYQSPDPDTRTDMYQAEPELDSLPFVPAAYSQQMAIQAAVNKLEEQVNGLSNDLKSGKKSRSGGLKQQEHKNLQDAIKSTQESVKDLKKLLEKLQRDVGAYKPRAPKKKNKSSPEVTIASELVDTKERMALLEVQVGKVEKDTAKETANRLKEAENGSKQSKADREQLERRMSEMEKQLEKLKGKKHGSKPAKKKKKKGKKCDDGSQKVDSDEEPSDEEEEKGGDEDTGGGKNNDGSGSGSTGKVKDDGGQGSSKKKNGDGGTAKQGNTSKEKTTQSWHLIQTSCTVHSTSEARAPAPPRSIQQYVPARSIKKVQSSTSPPSASTPSPSPPSADQNAARASQTKPEHAEDGVITLFPSPARQSQQQQAVNMLQSLAAQNQQYGAVIPVQFGNQHWYMDAESLVGGKRFGNVIKIGSGQGGLPAITYPVDTIAIIKWGSFGFVMAFTKDVIAGPPITLSYHTYSRERSVNKTRGTKLCEREQQTLLRLENGSHLYTPWRVQMDPSLPAMQRGHCAMTSRNKSHCNCVLYVEDESRDPILSIRTKANRFYHAWPLVIVDYG